ncbi:valacyclovir hydrolase [Anthonomus grandis grandis]|uniref:valacyclovir hydrolase n=1 Tax=Anthonomus grandis grandis TaxID=2921223 RepID=UPI0021654B13|nr:valacyclovir hydrolase [Anthonomus grandis grandis]
MYFTKTLMPSRALKQLFKRKYSPAIKSSKGQTINYLKVGEGPNKLLCFPGALGTIWSDFKPQIDGLDRSKFTLIAWDPPGYGASRPPNRVFDKDFYETDADAAQNLMQNLGIDKYSLLGWSDGGISSLIQAAKYPDSVDKLVVWGANAYLVPDDIKAFESIRDLSKWSPRMKEPLIKLYTEQGLQQMWNDWCDVMAELFKDGGDICKSRLKDIRCPTLILHGDKDPMVLGEHPEFLLKHIKGSRLHRYPEGKHNIHLKYAEDFNKIVSEFIVSQ